eukprot:m.103473 g.103473  ORF g.103473 m.103473 type:complete len:244 (+) comp13814_c0_seq2:1033-1764(+)
MFCMGGRIAGDCFCVSYNMHCGKVMYILFLRCDRYSPLLPTAVQGKQVVFQGLMHVVDWLPTIIAATMGTSPLQAFADTQASKGFALDGVNMWSAICGLEAGNRTEALLECDPYSFPLDRNFPGDQHGNGAGTPYYAIRRNQWKLLVGDPGGGNEDGWFCQGPPCVKGFNASTDVFNSSSIHLYDVVGDPGEHINQAFNFPDLVADLMASLRKYNESAVSSAWEGYPVNQSCVQNGSLTPWLP